MATRADDVLLTTRNATGMPSGATSDSVPAANRSPRLEANRAVEQMDLEDDNAAGREKTGLPALLEQPAVKRFAPYLAAVLVLALGAVVYSTLSQPVERPLYPNMADADKEAALTALTNGGIEARLDPSTGTLVVNQEQFHEARILLASQGLPRAATTGFSSLQQSMPLGTSQFMEQMRYNASVEEELAESIKRINSIENARVHLALPRQSAFVRDRADPKASVVVTPFNGRSLGSEQVQAIIHLVSSSVPYLSPQNVSVVDQFGRLLTENETDNPLDVSARQLQWQRRLETEYTERVNALLAPIVGAANVRTQVSADIDFARVEQTEENFDPQVEGTVVRSEQTEQRTSTEQPAEGVPGSLSNQPPPDVTATQTAQLPGAGGAGQTTTQEQESRNARNFEVDRTVRHTVQPAARVRRVSVAVAVNRMIGRDESGNPAERALTPEEITQFTSLVCGAVGCDQQRGDVVSLVNTNFDPPTVIMPLPWYQQPQIIEFSKYGLAALVFMLFILVVIRPLVKRLTYVAPPVPEQVVAPAGLIAADAGAVDSEKEAESDKKPDDSEDVELQEGETLEQLKARLKPKKKQAISADMLDTANSYDDKVTVVRMLVNEDARRVALVMKNLISKDMS